MASLSAHTGGDIDESDSWCGAGVAVARAREQPVAAHPPMRPAPRQAVPSPATRLCVDCRRRLEMGAGRQRDPTNFKLQREYLHGTRNGSLVVNPVELASIGSYRATPVWLVFTGPPTSA